MCHACLQRGKATDIRNGISDIIKTDFLEMGSDDYGTVTNAGPEGGVIRLYELHLKHPLQWLVFQLHFNELPLRALFSALDGPTTGPACFSGEVGSILTKSVELPIVKFRVIARIQT